MAADQFEELLKRMSKIAEVVNGFKSEAVQAEVYRTLVGVLGAGDLDDNSDDDGKAANRTRHARPKRKANDSSSESVDTESASVDTNDIVNTMKERADFSELSSKVLHARDLWDKIRLILYFADSAMTSGEIYRVLQGFDIKTTLPAVSKKLKEMHGQLISSGTRRPGAVIRYKLSGPAKSEAEKWMNEIVK